MGDVGATLPEEPVHQGGLPMIHMCNHGHVPEPVRVQGASWSGGCGSSRHRRETAGKRVGMRAWTEEWPERGRRGRGGERLPGGRPKRAKQWTGHFSSEMAAKAQGLAHVLGF